MEVRVIARRQEKPELRLLSAMRDTSLFNQAVKSWVTYITIRSTIWKSRISLSVGLAVKSWINLV